MVTAAETPNTVADDFEKAMTSKGQRDLSCVIDQVNKLRNDPDFIKSFNKSLKDGVNDIPELAGFELTGVDKEGDLRFSNKFGVRCEYKADGTKVEQWGAEKHDREFTVNENGTATHVVKKGETVWDIAKDICRERNGGEKPTNAQVAAEVKRIEEANKDQIKDIDKIDVGNKLIIPKNSVDEINAAREKQASEEKQAAKKVILEDKDKEGKTLFERIDVCPSDGKITKREISDYLEAHEKELSEEQKKCLRRVGGSMKEVKRSHDDGDENKGGATTDDIACWSDSETEKVKGGKAA